MKRTPLTLCNLTWVGRLKHALQLVLFVFMQLIEKYQDHQKRPIETFRWSLSHLNNQTCKMINQNTIITIEKRFDGFFFWVVQPIKRYFSIGRYEKSNLIQFLNSYLYDLATQMKSRRRRGLADSRPRTRIDLIDLFTVPESCNKRKLKTIKVVWISNWRRCDCSSCLRK